MYSRVLKRWIDLVAASLLLVLLSPVLAAVALTIRARIGAPILFKQSRTGLGGRLFTIRKFRTMTVRTEVGQPDDDARRLTPLGAFLRNTSLDELPELVNVLRGEMSLVGPRPLLPEYLPLYSPRQARRHETRPGITGWAQVNGRNALTWEARFELDVWYVDHQSLWLDLRIIGETVMTVLRREGIAHPSHATMERFRGTRG